MNNDAIVGHGGQNEGWMAQLLVSLKTRDGLVVLTNGTNGLRIISEVQCRWMQALRDGGCTNHQALPVEIPDAELQQLSGQYEDDSGARATLNMREGHLYWLTSYGYEFALRARSRNELYWVIGQNRLTFERDGEGKIVTMTRHRGDEKVTFRKIDESNEVNE